MEISTLNWHPGLVDPTGKREEKPRTSGKTMVIDKGLGLHSFEDLLQTAGKYIDVIKIGFGTSPLYPQNVLRRKIELANAHGICIMPGGTFLELAVKQDQIESYYRTVRELGFTGIEVSDGTIEMNRRLRKELIERGTESGFQVYTEYGKKRWGSRFDISELQTVLHDDLQWGSTTVIIEGRESGMGVGVYDENGKCRENDIKQCLRHVKNHQAIMWETPLKSQQIHFIQTFGPNVNLGNIAPADVLSVEALRRGLRSDTFHL